MNLGGKKEKPPLSVTHPEIAIEADGWDPSSVTAGSGKDLQWKCSEGHIWIARVAGRTYGSGCPFCAGQRAISGINDLATLEPELSKQAHGWDPKEVMRSSNVKREWKCSFGHFWFAPPNNRVAGNGCPICNGNIVLAGFNDLATLDPELAKEASGWDPSTVSKNSGKNKEWKCSLGHVWNATVNQRSSGYGCAVCSGQKVLIGFNDLATIEPEIAKTAFGWDPSTVTRSSRQAREWICEHGHVTKAPVYSRVNGHGCPICSGKYVLAGFNDFATLEPELAKEAYGWDPTTVTRSSGQTKKWICKLGHIWSAGINKRAHGRGCPICSGKKVLIGFNDLATVNPETAKEAFGWDPQSVTAGSDLKRKWMCEKKHVWTAAVFTRTQATPSGCPSCAKGGFDPNLDGYLYFLTHQDWEMLQIGITNFPDNRLRVHKRLGWKVLEIRGPMDGHLTQQWETAVLQMLRAKGADLSNAKIAGKFDGYSEAWSKSTFGVRSIKELMRLTEEFEEK